MFVQIVFSSAMYSSSFILTEMFYCSVAYVPRYYVYCLSVCSVPIAEEQNANKMNIIVMALLVGCVIDFLVISV